MPRRGIGGEPTLLLTNTPVLQAGTHRDDKGGLLPSAGRLPAFDALAAEFVAAADPASVEAKAAKEAAALSKGA